MFSIQRSQRSNQEGKTIIISLERHCVNITPSLRQDICQVQEDKLQEISRPANHSQTGERSGVHCSPCQQSADSHLSRPGNFQYILIGELCQQRLVSAAPQPLPGFSSPHLRHKSRRIGVFPCPAVNVSPDLWSGEA